MKVIFFLMSLLLALSTSAAEPEKEISPICVQQGQLHTLHCARAVKTTNPDALKNKRVYDFGAAICMPAGMLAAEACEDDSASKLYPGKTGHGKCYDYGEWVHDTVQRARETYLKEHPKAPKDLVKNSALWPDLAKGSAIQGCIAAEG